jgi:hypothetical protein
MIGAFLHRLLELGRCFRPTLGRKIQAAHQKVHGLVAGIFFLHNFEQIQRFIVLLLLLEYHAVFKR